MWATFGKKPQLMYLEQFFGFHPPSSNVCRMARGDSGKGLGRITAKSTFGQLEHEKRRLRWMLHRGAISGMDWITWWGEV